jgi:ribosomal protein S21
MKHVKNWGNMSGLSVQVFGNDVSSALRVLNKKIRNDGLMEELRRREFYVRPGESRRQEKEKSIARQKLAQKQNKLKDR